MKNKLYIMQGFKLKNPRCWKTELEKSDHWLEVPNQQGTTKIKNVISKPVCSNNFDMNA